MLAGDRTSVSVRPNQCLAWRDASQRAGVRWATASLFRRAMPGSTSARVLLHRHAQPTAGFHHRENRRDFRSGLRAAHMQPVLAPQRHRAHRVLRQSCWTAPLPRSRNSAAASATDSGCTPTALPSALFGNTFWTKRQALLANLLAPNSSACSRREARRSSTLNCCCRASRSTRNNASMRVTISTAAPSCGFTFTASTNLRRACAQQPTCTSFGPPTSS